MLEFEQLTSEAVFAAQLDMLLCCIGHRAGCTYVEVLPCSVCLVVSGRHCLGVSTNNGTVIQSALFA